MAHYKKDAASNRDALFGGGGGGQPRRSAPRASPPASSSAAPPQRPAASSTSAAARAATAASTNAPASVSSYSSAAADPSTTPGPSTIFASHGRSSASARTPLTVLTGQAKIAKMAEAEDYRLKAKKAMTRGIFSKPDPISASNYYKRAAEAYKQCGENRLERLHRIASGDCQLGQDAYATAAAEYTRAAELAEVSDETIQRKRQECHKLYGDAAAAWRSMGERGRAAEASTKAAFGLVMGEDASKKMDEGALRSVEEAIESFVGDPLNRKKDYRRTGASAYDDPNGDGAAAAALARQNIITDSYAHETLFKTGNELIKRRQYESALYAYGAGTASLEHEGFATVSLHRAYLSETILLLAMGDAVAASKEFQNAHLQLTSYLSSRECALEEDLVRAANDMDAEALDEARSRTGQHRAAMANLDPVLRELVGTIRVSGRAASSAVKKKGGTGGAAAVAAPSGGGGRPTPPSSGAVAPPPRPAAAPAKRELSGEELVQDTESGFAEMDDIMNQMGLNDDEEEEDDDDDIDLT